MTQPTPRRPGRPAPHRPGRTHRRLTGIALAVCALHSPAWALDYVWRGTDGNWSNSALWTLLGVPGAQDTATINNTGTGTVLLDGNYAVSQLIMNGGGRLGGTGSLTAGSLVFNGGTLQTGTFQTGGTLTVLGSTTFDGANNQSVLWSHVLNLNGNSTWTAGNGRLSVDSAYLSGGGYFPEAQLRIGSGTTFTDQGAANAAGYKVLGGGTGTVINEGTYNRGGAGATWLRGMVNAGTLNVNSGTLGFDTGNWLNTSSGQINVAAGAELQLAATTLSAGSLNNAGKVTVIGNDSHVAAAARISGNWQMNAGRLFIEGTQRIGTLTVNGGTITGLGALTVDQLSFNAGTLETGSSQTGGTLTVLGSTTFDGTNNQSVLWSHALNLNGNSTWTAGNGRLSVDSAYLSGGGYFPEAQLRIGSGTTFTDQGAANAAGYKVLGGGTGTVINEGTYNRGGAGATWLRGMVNAGTLNVNSGTLGFDTGNWLNTSSGQINVAAGAELLLAATTLSAGSLNNAGKVTVIGNDSHVAAAARISGNWQMNAGRLFIEGTQRIGTLTVNGGTIAGQGALTVDQLSFNAGTLETGAFQTGGTLTVLGNTTFDGTNNQSVLWSHVLNLNGNSTWTAGNGRLSVDSAYLSGSGNFPAALLRIGSGTTFTDQGAASAAAYKQLGTGGTVLNDGTYARQGLGETYARNFQNTGILSLNSGVFSVDDRFHNTGTVNLAAGTVLRAATTELANHGLIAGDGVVRTYNLAQALTNAGTLAPGGQDAVGTLTIDGDLADTHAAVLRIDLAAGGADLLAITSDVTWNGELALYALPGLTLHLGDSFTVATYGQRLAGSTFDSVSWHGAGANPFTVDYNAHDITLRVTSAVPEPAHWLLLALGLPLLAWHARRSA